MQPKLPRKKMKGPNQVYIKFQFAEGLDIIEFYIPLDVINKC